MPEQITILYLITGTNAGGTEKALWELVRRLDRSRFAAHVCSMKRPGRFAPRLAEAAAGFYTLGLDEPGGIAAGLNFVPALLRLIRLAGRLRPRILHSFLFRANICGRLAGRLTGIPVVISSLRVSESAGLPHAVERATRGFVDFYTAVSEAVRQEAITRSGIAPEKIMTIYNGIEPGTAECPCAPGASGAFTVALPGRLHRQKGHEVLFDALKILSGEPVPARALLFGEGPEEGRLRQAGAGLGLQDRVDFMGVVDDMAHALAGADAVVLPSLWEGMPNAVLEAMAQGKPVIASRIPGMDELVQAGRTGLLFTPGSAEELAACIKALASDPARCRDMGRQGTLLVKQRFSIHNTVAANAALYEALLASRRNHRER